MIIVEGPDGAGKSTLISQLQGRYGIEVAPRVVSKDAEAMVDLKVWVDHNVREGFQYKIFDRHRLISEFIYGPLLRTEQQPGFTNLAWVQDRLRDLYYYINPIIIYCLPPLEVVKQNIRGDEDNKVVADKVEGMYTAYTHLAALDMIHHDNTIIWDYTSDYQFELETDPEADPLRFFDPVMDYARDRAGRKTND